MSSFISNTTKGVPYPKYGGSYISAPGSKINKPQDKSNAVVWGIPQNSSGIPTPNMQTANSTPQTTQPVTPITRSGSTPYQPSGVNNSPAAPTGGGLVATPYADNSAQAVRDRRFVVSGAKPTPVKGVLPTPTGQSSNLNKYGQDNGSGLKGYNYDSSGNSTGKTSQFNQFTSGLLNKSDASQSQKDYLDKLERQSQKGEAIGRKAEAISAKYGGEIDRVGKLGAGAVAGAKSTGTDVVGRGNAQLASESASNRISALSAAQAAELQGTQQQLTGAEQGITGLTNTLTGANTQQQLGINALQAGGNLAMPSPAAYGQTVFDPTTGQYTGGGNMDPQQQSATLAQQVINGQMTYDQAMAAMAYSGDAGKNFLTNAITQAGGNPLELQAQSAGQQANIATQTTAGTDIARSGLQESTQQYMQMTNFAEVAHQQANAVSNILAQAGLNDVNSTDYNKVLNEIKSRVGDTNFASLNTALQEAQIAYTNLLSAGGGTPSGREDAALNTLNINQPASAINASIQELEAAVARKLQAQYGVMTQYNQNLGSGNTMGGGGGSTGGGFAETW